MASARNKPLSEPILTQIYVAILCYKAIISFNMIYAISITIHFLTPTGDEISLPFPVDEELIKEFQNAPLVSIGDALKYKKFSRLSVQGTVLELSAIENVVFGSDKDL